MANYILNCQPWFVGQYWILVLLKIERFPCRHEDTNIWVSSRMKTSPFALLTHLRLLSENSERHTY
jgi:hypothetical protein